MKEWERKVCEEITALGRKLDPPGDLWAVLEIIFLGALGERALMAWRFRERRPFDYALHEARGFTEAFAKCADPSYDPARDPDCPEGWRFWLHARILSPLSPPERARLIYLLGHLIHCKADSLEGAWGDDAQLKAAVDDALEVGCRLHGLDFDPKLIDW